MLIIDQIKDLFAKESKETFVDKKLNDGTIVRIEGELKEGSKVSVINEDGSLSPAPKGDHILEDESIVSVDDKGIITKIEAKAKDVEAKKEGEEDIDIEFVAEDETVTEEVKVEEKPADESNKVIDDLKLQIEELKSALMIVAEEVKALKEYSSSENELMGELKKENKTLQKEVKELKAQPATEKAKFKRVEEIISTVETKSKFEHFKDKKITPSLIAKLREENK